VPQNELRIFVPVAIRALMDRLSPRLEAAAGVPLLKIVDLNPAIPKRIAAGEAFDLGLTNPPYALSLIEAGHADAQSHRAFGRVPLAVARKAGGENLTLENATEIVALFRQASSIAYTGAGTSGQTYLDAMERLGLTEAIVGKSRPMGAGEPVASVAAGETELAVAPLTTVMASPGVAPAAIFPAELGTHIDMSVFLSPTARQGAVKALAFLTSPDIDEDLAAAGVTRFSLG